MKKKLNDRNSTFLCRWYNILMLDQRGAILIILILSMVIVAGLGTAVVSMYTTAIYNQVGSSNTIRTQHMAESGGRFTKDYIAKNGVDAAETYFNNGGTNLVFNLSGNDGSFSTNFTSNNADDDYSFTTTGTVNGISRDITFTMSPVTSLIPTNGGCGGNCQDNPGSDHQDEAFDGDTGSDGYRSGRDGMANDGVSYIGWNFGTAVKIRTFKIWQDGDNDTRVKQIKVQYSDDGSSWVDAEVVWLGTGRIDEFTIDPAGAHQYWAVRAFCDGVSNYCPDDEEWFVDELTMSPLPEITQN